MPNIEVHGVKIEVSEEEHKKIKENLLKGEERSPLTEQEEKRRKDKFNRAVGQRNPNYKFTKRTLMYQRPDRYDPETQETVPSEPLCYDELTAHTFHLDLLQKGYKYLGDQDGDMSPPREEFGNKKFRIVRKRV